MIPPPGTQPHLPKLSERKIFTMVVCGIIPILASGWASLKPGGSLH
jgi:hypothetical protein